MRFLLALSLFFSFPLILAIPAHAQSGSQATPGSSQSKGREAERERQSAPGFKELLDSTGRLLTDKLRGIAGLGKEKKTRWDSNASPRDSVFTFTHAMDDKLYMNEETDALVEKTLPPNFQADGQEALALKQVFDRIGEIPAIDLPAAETAGRRAMNSFELFPYTVDHEWMWQALGKAPEGKIVLTKDSAGTWRFSQETLAGAPALLESMRDIAPRFGNNKDRELVTRVFSGVVTDSPWWSWLTSLTAIIGGIFAGIYIRRGIRRIGEKMEESNASVIASMIRGIGTSVAILAGTLILVIGTSFIALTPTLSEIYWGLVRAILLIAAIWVVFGLTDLVATLVRRHTIGDSNEYGEMTVTIIQRVLRSFLFIILVIFILENLLGLNIGALIAGLGIVGLAVSLAGKETAQNLFGAISIFINRPFVVGDWISFKNEVGEVSDVRMQATHIRLVSGEMLIVPNMQFISNEVENLGMRKYLRRTMDISIPYGTPGEKVDRAMELLSEILRRDDIVEAGRCDLEEHPPIISFKDFADYYLHIRVYYWYLIGEKGEKLQRNDERGWYSYLDHCTLVNRAVLDAFDENDIEFAFPTQTIQLEKAAS